jgi:diguanylate cyclase (GGDEF)-like protein
MTERTPPPLEAILAEAPFGLAVRSPGGETLFANAVALAPAPDGEALASRSFAVEHDGRCYDVTLAVDDRDQRAVEDELFERAYYDELTRLPNRSLIEKVITGLIEKSAGPFALAFVDLDGFKHVNDFYGHGVGDELLVQFARRINGTLKSSDMLARQSGDEFLLLLADRPGEGELAGLLTTIGEKLRAPYYIQGYEIFSSASVGISRFPTDGATYNDLVSSADRAMYRGKKARKGTIQFFDASIEHEAGERSRLEQRLRLAIRDRRMCCAYQPKVEFRTGRVVGVEVLMRWRDEDGLIQAPGGMIELAVELGLMDQLTHLIVEEAIADQDHLDDVFGPDIKVSLNVAAKQATNMPFMQSLIAAIATHGEARRYMLELTEEAFLAKDEFRTHILPLIREAGMAVSIDDFGVGYSSLAALADITADEVKVDRSFVTDIHKRPRSQSILKAIESLGNSLGMSVVVEGVETFEELAYLQAATRIQVAQGYYFARPMLLNDLSGAKAVVEPLRSVEAPRETGPARLTGAMGRSPLVANRSR